MVKERMVFSGGAEITVSDARDGNSSDRILIQSPSVGQETNVAGTACADGRKDDDVLLLPCQTT